MEPIYSGKIFKAYVYNGWPIIEYQGKYWTKNREYLSLKDAIKAIGAGDEPDFILPTDYIKIDNSKTYDVYHNFAGSPDSYKFYFTVVSPFVPTSPNFLEYGLGKEPEEISPKYVSPGFGHNIGYVSYSSNAFELIRPEKIIENLVEFHTKYIKYTGVPFKEFIADVELPWKETKPIIEKLSAKDIPKKYIKNPRKLPFSKELQNGIKRILIDNMWKSEEYYFIGWDDETFYSLTLVKWKYDGSETWYLDYAPLEKIKNPWTQSAWDIDANTKSVKIDDTKILKDVIDVYELIDYLVF